MSESPVRIRMVRFSTIVTMALGVTSAIWAALPQAETRDESQERAAESDARKKQREENLKSMGRRAAATKVRPVDGEKPQAAELITKPLFHYTDEPRRIVDATLWGWTTSGRLQAVCKIEHYDFPQPGRKWLYCFGSLSTGLIEVDWSDEGRRWTSRKPGIELQSIAEAPAAAEGKPARLRQMKDIANRFQATILVDEKKGETQEMRLLPRPLWRYEQPAGELVDGALFGLTTNGTNPDAILVIELQKPADKSPRWSFGVAGMTAGGVVVKLDDKEIWSKPFVSNRGDYDTWLWFHAKAEE